MDFYYTKMSAPCRSVLMTAKALNIALNLKTVNVMQGETLKPEFLKLNPQHTVPTLVDNEFSIWESRAICVYLVEKFGRIDDPLYSKDPKTKALINQRLYFDMGTLFKSFYDHYFAPFFGKEQTPEGLKKLQDALELLNTFLENTGFVAGTQTLTIADLVIYSSVSTFEAFEVDFSPYPRIQKWLGMMHANAPGRELNAEGVQEMKQAVEAFKSSQSGK